MLWDLPISSVLWDLLAMKTALSSSRSFGTASASVEMDLDL
ncbi:MAG: hypothetical protein RXP91_05970 [Nitrososphaeria archaeon]